MGFPTFGLGQTQVASTARRRDVWHPERKIVLLDIGDGSHIELFQPTTSTPAPGSPAANDPTTHIALTASDTRAATAHVRAGYLVTVEPKEVRLDTIDAVISFFFGPNGEVIEFFQTR